MMENAVRCCLLLANQEPPPPVSFSGYTRDTETHNMCIACAEDATQWPRHAAIEEGGSHSLHYPQCFTLLRFKLVI